MRMFLDAVLYEFMEASALLERRARGDYSPDANLKTLPAYAKAPKAPVEPGSGKTCYELFGAYVEAVKPARSTVTRWRSVFIALDAYLNGRSVDALEPDEAQRWIASLITGKRKARTVKDTWASASRTVFAWAVGQKLIGTNPFADVAKTIRVPRQAKNREDGKAFSEAEQQTILKAALAVKDTKSPIQAAYRWAPWLCAYSGARAGEITQLRGQDIEQRSGNGVTSGYVVMKLTPDAGTIKGLQARTVPIHEHMIAQGFLDFVKSRGKGPLFYRPDTKKHGAEDPLRPRRPSSLSDLAR
jgi:integrase